MEEVFKLAVPFLLDCVANEEEEPIVRHEVHICLGENVDEKPLIEHFLKNEDLLVSQSCEIALGLIDYRKRIEEEEEANRKKEEEGEVIEDAGSDQE